MTRSELNAFEIALRAVGDSRVVLATGMGSKSALALGLATVAAVKGSRTALVECDLPRPSLAARLGLAPTPGLSEYLREEAEAGRILQPLVPAGPASGGATAPLTCVVAGEPGSDGPALLASEAFDHAIAKLRSAYDLVVLDGPPLRDELALLAVVTQADKTLACGSASVIPRKPVVRVDGLVVQA
jgi:tyrosine-protein kinase Etk/Wzc